MTARILRLSLCLSLLHLSAGQAFEAAAQVSAARGAMVPVNGVAVPGALAGPAFNLPAAGLEFGAGLDLNLALEGGLAVEAAAPALDASASLASVTQTRHILSPATTHDAAKPALPAVSAVPLARAARGADGKVGAPALGRFLRSIGWEAPALESSVDASARAIAPARTAGAGDGAALRGSGTRGASAARAVPALAAARMAGPNGVDPEDADPTVGDGAVNPTPDPPIADSERGPRDSRSKKAVRAFIAGLLVAQAGAEVLGVAMPQIIRQSFGSFTFIAQLAMVASAAGIAGRLIGGWMSNKFGLKWTYIGANVLRLASTTALVWFLSQGAMTLTLMAVLYGVNGFLAGVSLTAMSSIPRALLGKNRTGLNKFFALKQFSLETVAIIAPIAAGWVVANYGFSLALWFFPISFALANVIYFFWLDIPKADEEQKRQLEREKEAQGRAADGEGVMPEAAYGNFVNGMGLEAGDHRLPHDDRRAAQDPPYGLAAVLAKDPPPGSTPEKPKKGWLDKVGLGGVRILFGDKVLRTTFFAYTAFSIINPLLYSIVAPAFGLLVAGGVAEAATGVSSLVTGLYSAGGLVAGVIMYVAENRLEKKRDAGEITPEQEAAAQRKSTIRWMVAAAAASMGFWTTLLVSPILTYGAMALFGLASVTAIIKLYTMLQSQAPKGEVAKVNASIGSLSVGVTTGALWAAGTLFDMSGTTPFLYFNAGLVVLAVVGLGLTWLLARQTKSSELDA